MPARAHHARRGDCLRVARCDRSCEICRGPAGQAAPGPAPEAHFRSHVGHRRGANRGHRGGDDGVRHRVRGGLAQPRERRIGEARIPRTSGRRCRPTRCRRSSPSSCRSATPMRIVRSRMPSLPYLAPERLRRQALPGRDERRLMEGLAGEPADGRVRRRAPAPDRAVEEQFFSAAGSSGRPSSRRSPASRATAACRA